ncbi:uncharacterized [Tachysurus ichikawai]
MTPLIPSLQVYHPSDDFCARTFEIFDTTPTGQSDLHTKLAGLSDRDTWSSGLLDLNTIPANLPKYQLSRRKDADCLTPVIDQTSASEQPVRRFPHDYQYKQTRKWLNKV